MNILERIQACLPSLTNSERKVAEYIILAPIDVVRFPSEYLAQRSGGSRGAIIRLCQKLGYKGYSEFKYDMSKYMTAQSTPAADPASHTFDGQSLDCTGGCTVLDRYCRHIMEMSHLAGSSQLKELARAVRKSANVITLGQYHTGYSAMQLAFRLNRHSISSHCVTDPSIMDNYGCIVTKEDTAVIMSISGNPSYIPVCQAFKKRDTKVFLVTMTAKTPLGKYVDSLILLPCITLSTNTSFLDDQPVFFIFTELLLEEVRAQGVLP